FDETLGGQVEQRGPQGLPGHPERAGQLLLDKPLARREVSAEYRLPERGERMNPRLFPGPRPARRSCCHDSTLRTFDTDCQQLSARIVDNPLRATARLGATADAGLAWSAGGRPPCAWRPLARPAQSRNLEALVRPTAGQPGKELRRIIARY